MYNMQVSVATRALTLSLSRLGAVSSFRLPVTGVQGRGGKVGFDEVGRHDLYTLWDRGRQRAWLFRGKQMLEESIGIHNDRYFPQE